MAAGNPARIIRAPGKLVVNPTDLTTAYPYGGTEVGLTKTVVVKPQGNSYLVSSEGRGEISDFLEADNRWVVGFYLRGFDDDALLLLHPDFAEVGEVTGHTSFRVPARAVPGASALPRARKLLYVPDDPINTPALLVYRGIPDFENNSDISFQRKSEFGMAMAVECLRDEQNRILEIGRLADMPPGL